ncbi:MAG: phosphatase PAP2 family protein [Candidatus Pacearchaeota archaeon]
MKNSKKKKKIKNIQLKLFSLILLITILFLSFIYDFKIVNFFYNNKNKFLFNFMSFISSYNFLIPFLLSIFLFLIFQNKKNAIKIPISVFLTIVIIYFLKIIFLRTRPFSLERDSFPSFHSALGFNFLPFFDKNYKFFWLIFSLLVAFSRLYLGEHYLTDIIFGSIVGYFIGIYTNILLEKRIKKKKKKINF